MKSWTGSWSKRFPRAIHRKSRAPLQQGEMGSGKETFPIRLGRWASAPEPVLLLEATRCPDGWSEPE